MSEQPQTFGKYQLIRQIGKGGFGEVWLAFDPQTKSKVALKVLHQSLMSDAQFIKKAQDEARLTQKIAHPNVVKVLEVGQAAGRVYIAMDYIDGPTLAELIKSGRKFTIDQSVTLVEQVAAALDATHMRGVIHRDVKPANILVDSNGNAHLVDFGLAHAAQTSLGQSAQSVGMGTAMYMSPEQASGQKGDRTTDVYSLAVIAYELLASRLPFQADNMMGYMMAHKDQTPPPLSKFNPAISADVEKVILKGLSKDPAKRYKTAGIFASTLQKAAARPFRKSGGQRSRTGCVVVPVAVVLLISIAVGSVALGIVKLPPEIAKVIGQTTPTAVVQAPPTTQPQPTATPRPTDSPATSTTAPVATATAGPTELPSTTAPTVTPLPTNTPIPAPTATPTNTPAPGELVELIGTGAQVASLGNGATKSGQGRITVLIRNGLGQPINNHYVRISTQKKDLSDQWVVDQEITNAYTDNTGTISFDVAPGRYIVRSDFSGYNWGTARDVMGQADVPIEAGQITQLTISLSRLTVGFLRADGSIISNQYVRVWKQKRDLAGHWVTDNEVINGYTDNTGLVGFDLAPGYYIVGTKVDGYNWGDASDVMGTANTAMKPGAETQIILKLGQLAVGLIDPAGKPRNSQYVRVFTQQTDAAGNPITDNEVINGYTDNTGSVIFNLTPGSYAVRIGDQTAYNVMVEAGRITQGDGTHFEIKP